MGAKYFKNSICSLVIVSIIVLPYLSAPRKVEAVEGITGYVQSLSPIISQLFQCKGKAKEVFSQAAGNLVTGASAGNSNTSNYDSTGGLGSTSDSAGAQATAVETFDSTTFKEVQKVSKDGKEVLKNVKETNVNETCLKSIGKLVIKMLLQKVTQSTVAWINSGFEGGPAFIQDAPTFWKDVARDEILGFSAEINNPLQFPFGQAFIESQVSAFNNHFQDNARYSLNELMDNSDTTINGPFSASIFMEDFSHGGWDAWNYMTQVPANNPLGFNVIASTELSARLEGTGANRAQEIRESLQQAGGFLGQERCADPEGLTRDQHRAGLTARASNPASTAPICNDWQYVTPGQMVAESATKLVHYPDNQYLNADDLNDAIGAILDALLAQWSTDLQDGFAEFSTQGAEGDLVINFDNYNQYGDGTNPSQIQTDFPSYQLETPWFSANPDFNIRTDITQALIDEQRIYIEKLEAQNKELMSKNGSQNYGLIPIIYQLDYCIPGPHPGWEEDSREALDEQIGEIQDASGMTDDNVDTFNTAWSFIDPLGFLSTFTDMIAAGALQKTRELYYAKTFKHITGIHTDADDGDNDGHFNQWVSRDFLIKVIDIIFSKYKQILNDIYRLERMPGVTIEARGEFNKIPAYKEMVENNTETIALMKSTVAQLSDIKTEVEALNAQYNSGMPEAEYEAALQDWILAFGRLTENMITGNEIAAADNVLKQIKDKAKYIYISLIKGPQGCEKELMDRPDGFKLPWETYELKRMLYPRENPLLYDYNSLTDNQIIPNPFGGMFDTNEVIRMPNLHTSPDSSYANSKGPGFLSFLAFGGTDTNTLYIEDTFGDPNTENTCYSSVYPNGNTDIKRNSGWAPICGLDLYPITPGFFDHPIVYSEETTGNLLIGIGTDKWGTQIGTYTPKSQEPAPGVWDNRKNNGNFEDIIKIW